MGNIHNPNQNDWLPQEITFLEDQWQKQSAKWIAEKLDYFPRTTTAVRCKARALGLDEKKTGPRGHVFSHGGITLTVSQWAKKLGITTAGFHRRVQAGMKGDELFAKCKVERKH